MHWASARTWRTIGHTAKGVLVVGVWVALIRNILAGAPGGSLYILGVIAVALTALSAAITVFPPDRAEYVASHAGLALGIAYFGWLALHPLFAVWFLPAVVLSLVAPFRAKRLSEEAWNAGFAEGGHRAPPVVYRERTTGMGARWEEQEKHRREQADPFASPFDPTPDENGG